MIDIKGPSHPMIYTGKRSPLTGRYKTKEVPNVAFLGFARAGKDTAAEVAVEEFGYERFAFADKLRDCLYALNPTVAWVDHDVEGKTYTHLDGSTEPLLKFTVAQPYETVQSVIDEHGWDGYKETVYGDEIRGLLQRFGTEVGRELLSDTIWVDEVDKHTGPLAITDCRFDNEYDKLAGRGTIFVRVNRAGITAVNAHKSENDFSDRDVDFVVDNDGTLEEFKAKIRDILQSVVK